jgi:hypothetical protein
MFEKKINLNQKFWILFLKKSKPYLEVLILNFNKIYLTLKIPKKIKEPPNNGFLCFYKCPTLHKMAHAITLQQLWFHVV